MRALAASLVLLAALADVLLVLGTGNAFNLPMAAAGGLFASGYFAWVAA